MATTNGPADFVVRIIAEFELSSFGRTAFRLEVKDFNGVPYVGLGQFFFQQDLNKWLPTKKQFYMPIAVWHELPKFIGAVNRALNRGEPDDNYDDDVVILPTPSIGMKAIPRLRFCLSVAFSIPVCSPFSNRKTF